MLGTVASVSRSDRWRMRALWVIECRERSFATGRWMTWKAVAGMRRWPAARDALKNARQRYSECVDDVEFSVRKYVPEEDA